MERPDTMHPQLLRLANGLTVYSYGLCLMLAMVVGIVLAFRRAKRAGVDPFVILNVALLAVVFGIGGARVMHVIHYWDNFASRSNVLLAVLDMRRGGLEFLGGFVGATVAILAFLLYPRRVPGRDHARRRLPLRLYLDVLTPSLMIGLAITRVGCFLNGCCYGAPCAVPETGETKYAWAVQFPYGSPVFMRQWEQRRVTVPAALVHASRSNMIPTPRRREEISAPTSPAPRRGQVEPPASGSPGNAPAVLRELASAERTVPVHPTQLYASINAFLLYAVLAGLFRVRRRHGVVFAAMLLLYPPSRFVLEMIRADNPHDTLGMTISQFVSVVMFLGGAALMFVLVRYLPERSPEPVAVTARVETTSRRSSRRRKRRATAKRR